MPDITRQHRLDMEPQLEKQVELIQEIRVEYLKIMKKLLENDAPVDRHQVITMMKLLFEMFDRCENATKGELRALVIIENATHCLDHLMKLCGKDEDYLRSIPAAAAMKHEWFENA